MDIKRFQQQVKSLSEKLDTHTPERRIVYLISELGEVADEVIELMNTDPDTSVETVAALKDRIGMEIYDVIWNVVDLANMLEIDLEKAFEKKIAFNKERRWTRSGLVDDES